MKPAQKFSGSRIKFPDNFRPRTHHLPLIPLRLIRRWCIDGKSHLHAMAEADSARITYLCEYLQRISFPLPEDGSLPAPTLKTLWQVHTQHALSIPWENLSFVHHKLKANGEQALCSKPWQAAAEAHVYQQLCFQDSFCFASTMTVKPNVDSVCCN